MTVGRYRTTAFWYPHEPTTWETDHGSPGWQPDPVHETHPDLAAAERSGQVWGCLRGIRRVEVHAPDGTLQARWDKESRVLTKHRRYTVHGRMIYDVSPMRSRWQSVGHESQTMNRSRVAETLRHDRTA